MWQSSLTGPSRNACSSAVSRDGATASSFAQSGLPANRSASHHTSPASIASRSVSKRVCSTWGAQAKIGLDNQSRRNEGSLIDAPARCDASKAGGPSCAKWNSIAFAGDGGRDVATPIYDVPRVYAAERGFAGVSLHFIVSIVSDAHA